MENVDWKWDKLFEGLGFMIEICENKRLSKENIIVMELSEDEKIYGTSQIRIKGDWAYLENISIEPEYDFFPIYDGLVRATINKALHKGVLYFAFLVSKEKYQYLSKNRFMNVEEDTKYKYVDIEEFFSRRCSGGR